MSDSAGLDTSTPRAPAAPFAHAWPNLEVVHALRRRIRIQAPALRKDPERCYLLQILLLKHAGIRSVRVVADLGSVAIRFNPEQLPRANLLQVADHLIASLGRRRPAPETPGIPVGNGPVREWQFAIEGMTCVSCALLIEMMLKRQPGIRDVSVNFATETATVRAVLGRDAVMAAIARLGYRAHAADSIVQRKLMAAREAERLRKARRQALVSVLLSAPVIVLGMVMPHGRVWAWLSAILTTPVVLGSGRSFFSKAWKLAGQGTANMDSLVALGVGAAYGSSVVALLTRRGELYFEAAAAIVSFVLYGRYVEETSRGRAHEAIRRLLDLQPATATLLKDGEEFEVPVESLQVGDVVRVRPGDRLPTDGEVLSGISGIDESMVTGESVPAIKRPGDRVIGGCVNGSGALQVRVTAVGEDTVLAGIIHMVEQAQSSKLPIQKTVDRVSAVFVPTVLVISAGTFLGWVWLGAPAARAFANAIAVLLIACPCALGLATPAAIMVGTGQAARKGIYIRNGESLEMASKLTAIVFDKTGTITEGKPEVTDLIRFARLGETRLLSLAAAAEIDSEHFLARAIVRKARDVGAEPLVSHAFDSVPGRGIRARVDRREVLIGNAEWLEESGVGLTAAVEPVANLAGQGKTPVFMALDGKLAAVFGIADRPREHARAAIQRLQDLNVRTLMVTGDVEAAAQHIAQQVGIAEVTARARPERKLEIIRALQEQGERVGMIGDGVNDAPALAAADVSFAIGSGTDVAIQTADMIISQGDISRVADGMALSQFTLRVVHQNLAWAFGYNTIAIPLAVMGRLSPMIAAGAMAFSSVSVVLNSLRLQRR
ncbi:MULTISPECIES: heavy metal translocating P-type ATPase [Methylococcus]|uniref:heavy metal translocating P-type ATPase n=1 Tax=Methylococcus TaxID=413 RepID=UPI001C52E209|nr:heavy metal translocating P-type ATPase [Methylococcus capsulatus]QXP88422.1 heavy metal translocating P-type ATPase [Methylococcus capsulatus]QXP94561.1 heavy metal translocating P-type ATPase [Methylococcus capsulatus]UQN13465.1 heavy metal translocating P-type ATPase [Methylococcus capsulatus]